MASEAGAISGLLALRSSQGRDRLFGGIGAPQRLTPRSRESARDFLLRVEFAPQPRQLLGAQQGDVAVVALPGRDPRSSAAATAPWSARHGAASSRRSASSSVKACDAGSCGLPAELPSGKSREQKPRHRGVFDDVLGAAHHDGGNAIGLQMPGDQADGLVADRTVRHQHGGIDVVRRQRARISGASVSMVTRWLRLVGAPKKRGATSPMRP